MLRPEVFTLAHTLHPSPPQYNPPGLDGAVPHAPARGLKTLNFTASSCICHAALLLVAALFCGFSALAGDTEQWALHGQITYTEQETSDFNAPYSGTNSLSPRRGAETVDATLYAGVRPWQGAEIWINPEIDQGKGLDDTLGVAGFPSGEAYKVGRDAPYFRLQRLFLRQTLDLSGEAQLQATQLNQLGGAREANRLVITVGKISVADIFDVNTYAHDPRMDFLNWTAIDTGTFDYAADAWGYSAGLAFEWYQGDWTLRGGAFDLSNVPNSVHLDPGLHEFQLLAEVEHRHRIGSRDGKLMLTGYDSRGRMALLDQAVALAAREGSLPTPEPVRAYRSRFGLGLSAEQELTETLGAFARLGKAQGNVEAYEFTDVDRSLALGLSLNGRDWRRADDTIGLAGINNNASAARQQYLAAGGLGILTGDGRLPRPGPEQILETYYSLAVLGFTHITFDYQWINHPAYNLDRGPVSVFAVRAHAQF